MTRSSSSSSVSVFSASSFPDPSVFDGTVLRAPFLQSSPFQAALSLHPSPPHQVFLCCHFPLLPVIRLIGESSLDIELLRITRPSRPPASSSGNTTTHRLSKSSRAPLVSSLMSPSLRDHPTSCPSLALAPLSCGPVLPHPLLAKKKSK